MLSKKVLNLIIKALHHECILILVGDPYQLHPINSQALSNDSLLSDEYKYQIERLNLVMRQNEDLIFREFMVRGRLDSFVKFIIASRCYIFKTPQN